MVAKRLAVFLLTAVCVVGVGQVLMSRTASAASGTQPAKTAHQSANDNDDATLYNIATPNDTPIPSEALRLRIIANSDRSDDQAVKLDVRNAVVAEVAGWLTNAHSSAEARAIVTRHIPQIEALAKKVVRQHGFTYAVTTNVGRVPFPTKIYGNQVYPAGNYEALRITLGSGRGKNWWCVLFPPLCFVDIADGDAVPNTAGFPDLPPLETIQVPSMNGQPTKVQVRLASVDYGEELWHTLQNWMHKGKA